MPCRFQVRIQDRRHVMQAVGWSFPAGKLQIFHASIWILQHSTNVFLISDIQLKPTIDKTSISVFYESGISFSNYRTLPYYSLVHMHDES